MGIITNLLETILFVAVGFGLCIAIIRLCPLVFNIDLIKELKNQNQAVSFAILGIFTFVGLIMGMSLI